MGGESTDNLASLLAAFDRWALARAARTNTDWRTDFPRFGELVREAATTMRAMAGSDSWEKRDLQDLARAWSLSEESELLKDEAIEIGSDVVPLLGALFEVADADARWQIVAIAPSFEAMGFAFAIRAANDVDPYVRRRAWIAAAKIDASRAAGEAARTADETDPEVVKLLGEIASIKHV